MIICDIDDTLLRNGTQPIRHVIDWLNAQKGEKVIVTGRPESQRARTVAALQAAGVHYSRLIMNPYGTRDSNKHKSEVASRLNAKVSLAIDDNPGARRAYSKYGIPTKDPATIDKSWQTWDIFNK
jgi:hypothetical protein